MGSGEDPLGADKGAAAEILVERVDEGDLPAPLVRVGVLAAYDSGGSIEATCLDRCARCALHPAHVLAVHRALLRRRR